MDGYYGLTIPKDSLEKDGRKKRASRVPLESQLLPHLRFSSTEDHGDEDGPNQITPADPVQGIGAHPPEPHEGPQGREQRIYDGLDDEGEQLGDEKIPDARGRLNRAGEVGELQVQESADGQKGVIPPSVLSPEFSDGAAAALILLRHNEPTTSIWAGRGRAQQYRQDTRNKTPRGRIFKEPTDLELTDEAVADEKADRQ